MSFQIKEVQSFFPKHLKQNIKVLEFQIKLFSRCFAAFESQKGIVDH
jgi:hypothetical protein